MSVIGGLLTILVPAIGILVAVAASRTAPDSKVREVAGGMFGAFVLMTLFGIAALVAGLQQYRAGRTSRWAPVVFAGLAVALYMSLSGH